MKQLFCAILMPDKDVYCCEAAVQPCGDSGANLQMRMQHPQSSQSWKWF